MTGQELVSKYLASRYRFHRQLVQKHVVVKLDGACSDVPLVSVNCEAVEADPLSALEFAAEFAEACALALAAERIIDEWDGVDQWQEPGFR